jgi:hypothetical protein
LGTFCPLSNEALNCGFSIRKLPAESVRASDGLPRSSALLWKKTLST